MRYHPPTHLKDPTTEEELAAANSAITIAEVLHTHISEPLLPLMPEGAVRILDVGCGCGNLGERLKREDSKRYVVGVTISEIEAQRAAGRLDEVLLCDMNTFDLGSLPPFDVIVCSHTLGYFADPGAILRRLRGALVPNGTLLLSVPNVVNFKERWQFLRGRFRYQHRGVLEQFYLRFFDRYSLREAVQTAGFAITHWQDEGYLPQPLIRRVAPRVAAFVDRCAVAASPGFFGHTIHLAAQRIPLSDEAQ